MPYGWCNLRSNIKLVNQVPTLTGLSHFNTLAFSVLRSSATSPLESLVPATPEHNNELLKPYFVTGFSDGEASFTASVNPRSDYKDHWRTRVVFQIGLHLQEYPLLLSIQAYFNGVGVVYKDLKYNKAYYNVSKPEDLMNVIIPHFKSYPLLTQKNLDFNLWSKVVDIVVRKEHLTPEGLAKIIYLKTFINKGLSEKVKNKYISLKIDTPTLAQLPTIIPENFTASAIPDPNWLVGFTAGEGSFSVSGPKENGKTYFTSRFNITQHSRDLHLLNLITAYLEVGNIYKNGPSVYNIEVGSYKKNYEFIVPFFTNNPFPSVCLKANNFLIWKEIIEIMYSGEHLTSKNLYTKELISKLNKYKY